MLPYLRTCSGTIKTHTATHGIRAIEQKRFVERSYFPQVHWFAFVTHIHARTYIRIHVHVHVHMYTHTHTHAHTYILAHTHVHTHANV